MLAMAVTILNLIVSPFGSERQGRAYPRSADWIGKPTFHGRSGRIERAPGALGLGETDGEAAVAGADRDVLAADGADEDGAELLERGPVAADQEAAGALAEEGFLGLGAALAEVFDVGLAADAAGDSGLGDGDGEAAVGDVVGGGEPAGADRGADDPAGGGDRGDFRLGQADRQLAAL